MAEKDKLLQSKTVATAGKAGTLPKGWKVFGVPPKTVVLSCGIGEVVCPGVDAVNPTRDSFYLIKYDPTNSDPEKVVPEMTGADLKLSGTRRTSTRPRASRS